MTEFGVELNDVTSTFDESTLFSTKSPVGAGIGSVTSVGAIPFVAFISRDDADATEVPTAFVAVTEKVYTRSGRTGISQYVVGAVTIHVAPPGEAVTVYEVIGDSYSAFNIINDIGNRGSYYIGRFISLEEYRDIKLNKILNE